MNPALLALILTQAQAFNLNLAYNYGEPYGLAKTFQAVVLVESSGCLHESGDKGASLGCSQIQVYTARQTCNCGVTADVLRKDDHYNLQLGAKFLARCFDKFWPDRKRSIACYSLGIPAASKATANQIVKSRYIARVLRAEKMLEQVRVNTQ